MVRIPPPHHQPLRLLNPLFPAIHFFFLVTIGCALSTITHTVIFIVVAGLELMFFQPSAPPTSFIYLPCILSSHGPCTLLKADCINSNQLDYLHLTKQTLPNASLLITLDESKHELRPRTQHSYSKSTPTLFGRRSAAFSPRFHQLQPGIVLKPVVYQHDMQDSTVF